MTLESSFAMVMCLQYRPLDLETDIKLGWKHLALQAINLTLACSHTVN
jgi:hypothetical protein